MSEDEIKNLIKTHLQLYLNESQLLCATLHDALLTEETMELRIKLFQNLTQRHVDHIYDLCVHSLGKTDKSCE